MKQPFSLLLLVIVASACPEPAYDADIGVTGVPVQTGALAGTFVRASVAADQVELAYLGNPEGGGMTFLLVTRTWDGSTYSETDQPCAVENLDVAGVHTEVSTATARSAPSFAVPLQISHETGAFETGTFYETWAVRNLPEEEPFPTDPTDPRLYDMENDGHPGATLTASGIANGEMYIAQRKRYTLRGVIRSPDESFGLVTHRKDALVIDTTDPLLKTSAPRAQHPDPKESWWHEVRLPDGSTCDTVDQVMATNQPMSRLRPF